MDFVYFKLCFSVLLSFLFTYYLIPICIRVAHTYRVVDHPDGKIKMHEQPTPYLGGAAIYLGFLGTLGLVFPFNNQFFLFLLGTTLLFYVGLIDDLIVLRPCQKFVAQGIAVLCFLKAGFYLKAHIFYNFWSIPFSAIWMLLVINAFNLIDIMDGLASIVALGCSVNFLLLALYTQEYVAALLLCVMIGSLMAFLRFNLPPAHIYLGDAGSLFIGGFLSTIPFLFSWGVLHPYGYLIPLVILAIPLLEVCGLICIRTWKGIPFYNPSEDHFALYLKRKGYTGRHVLGFIVIASCMLILSSALFALGYIDFLTLLGLGLIFLTVWFYSVFS